MLFIWFLVAMSGVCFLFRGVAESIVYSIFEKIKDYLVKEISDIYFYSNMETLRREVEKLDNLKRDAEHSVQETKNNGELSREDVNSWLESVDRIIQEVKKLEDEATLNKSWLNGWCPDLYSRYWRARKAKKKTVNVIQLQKDHTWLMLADCKSRLKIMDEVMAALLDDNINAIGICGLGGVGKTTMVEGVCRRANMEKLFVAIVMTVVGKNADRERIQAKIAQRLGLYFGERDDFLDRADKLRNKLMDGKRRLVILDDVWERLDLKAIGIPFGAGYTGCKVILTSRLQDVCNGMKNFTIQVLCEAEAWSLFKKQVGNSFENSTDLHKVARKVVEECAGLPIAIVTVGAVLKGKTMPAWEDALLQLQTSIPETISGLLPRVYRCIDLSYNFLESQEAKLCLLLCCLYEEDTDIPYEDLFEYGVGLDFFNDINALEARSRVHTLVNKLKGSSLLLDGVWDESVKVHDVVRDVIRCKAEMGEESFMFGDGQQSKEWAKRGTVRKYSSLSLKSKTNNIDLLLLKGKYDSRVEVDENFEGMEEVKVLGMSRMSIPSSLTSLSFLKNIRTLCLRDCQLENIAVIGQLKSTLIILSLRHSSLEELPREIGDLTHLKLLDLTECKELKRISAGVIKSLIELEELYLTNSGLRWVVGVVGEEGNEKNEVSLDELGYLSNLIALKTCLPTVNFPGSNSLFHNLLSFHIRINTGEDWKWEPEDEFQNELHFNLDNTRIPSVHSGINELLRKTKALFLKLIGVKKVLNVPSLLNHMQLKALEICSCEGAKYLFETVDLSLMCPILEFLDIRDVHNLKMICHGELPAESFWKLSVLVLNNLPELMHLWKSPHQLVSLGNLRRIVVNSCDRLENLFSQSIAAGLEQLESLRVESCKMMEEIVAIERGEHGEATTKIRFLKLSELRLVGLPRLTSFCKKMDEIDFPQLNSLYLEDLPKLGTLFTNNLASEDIHETATQYPSNEEVSSPGTVGPLCELREMLVKGCNAWLNVTPLDLLQRFGNLEQLTVQECASLVQVFAVKGLVDEESDIVLPSKLKDLILEDLPELKHILWREPKGIQFFQRLRVLRVQNCNSLRNLFSTSMAKSAEQVEELVIINCKLMEEIVVEGENKEECKTEKIMMRQLKILRLCNLPKLTGFYQGVYHFDLPSLVDVTIEHCQEMRTFTFGSLSTPKLGKVVGLPSFHMGDLNKALKDFSKRNLREPRNWATRTF